ERILRQHLDWIAQAPPRDEWKTDAHDGWPTAPTGNLGLVWLLRQLPEEYVFDRYGDQLLRLRDRVRGGWRQEVQLALEDRRTKDRLELEAALKRLRDVRPLRILAPLRHGGMDTLTFTPDGRHLATAGHGHVRIWKTDDWSLAQDLPIDGASLARFSPDGRLLYVGGVEVHARYDWRTGKREKVYQADSKRLDELELSADSKRMLTAD